MTSAPEPLRDIIARHGLQASKALGQNFILDRQLLAKIAAVPGVHEVSKWQWFGAYYQDPKEFFAQFAITADTYLPMYPEIRITAGSSEEFMRERTAAIIGDGLVTKYGWQLGQTVTLKGTFLQGDFPFTIRAIYTPSDPAFGNEMLFFHYQYLYEMTNGQITPGWFVLQLDRPDSQSGGGAGS